MCVLQNPAIYTTTVLNDSYGCLYKPTTRHSRPASPPSIPQPHHKHPNPVEKEAKDADEEQQRQDNENKTKKDEQTQKKVKQAIIAKPPELVVLDGNVAVSFTLRQL